MPSSKPDVPNKNKLNIFSFSGKNKILHLGWMAFFFTFFLCGLTMHHSYLR